MLDVDWSECACCDEPESGGGEEAGSHYLQTGKKLQRLFNIEKYT